MDKPAKPFKPGLAALISFGAVLVTYNSLFFLSVASWLFFTAWWLLDRYKSNRAKRNADHIAKQIEEEFARFGNTADEREKAIHQFFDAATGTLRVNECVEIDWYGGFFDNVGNKVSASYSTNLGTMQPGQREALRILYVLRNRGMAINEPFWEARSTLIYNDGRTVFDSWKLSARALEYYKGHAEALQIIHKRRGLSTAGAAESFVRDSLQSLIDTKGSDPTVKAIKNRTQGGNAWLDASEVQGSVLDGATNPDAPFNCVLGPLADDPATVLAYRGQGSLISIGPPGGGKTQCHAIPGLLAWKGSAIVLDIKGEIYEATAAHKKKTGDVIRFSPFEKETASYNLLTLLPGEPDDAWAAAQELAEALHPSGLEDNANQKHWGQASREIITAALTLEAVNYAGSERRFGRILDMLSGGAWDSLIDQLIELAKTHGLNAAGRTAANFAQEQEDSPKQFTASRTSAYTALNSWNNPLVAKATQRSDWAPADLHHERPLTVYITATLQQLHSQAPLFRAILAQHVDQLLQERFLKPPRPLLLMLDEFVQLGRMEPLKRAVELGRGYGLRLWLLAQYEAQIRETYRTDGIVRSCAVRSYFAPDFDTAKQLSEELGQRTGALDGTRSPLLTPQDITGPEYTEIIFTFTNGQKPAKVQKAWAYAQGNQNQPPAAAFSVR